MNTIFKESIEKSLNYLDYRQLVEDLLRENKSTGSEQSEDLTNYSKLNVSRMNRLDKTLRLRENVVDRLKNLKRRYIVLVLSEGWCGDAAQTVPVLNKMAEASEHLDLKIVLRDDNESLMNQYLTNGGKSIPKAIIIDAESGEEVAHWGPRPAQATQLVTELKNKYGGITSEVKEGLQKWYNEDRGYAAQEEILALLKE